MQVWIGGRWRDGGLYCTLYLWWGTHVEIWDIALYSYCLVLWYRRGGKLEHRWRETREGVPGFTVR